MSCQFYSLFFPAVGSLLPTATTPNTCQDIRRKKAGTKVLTADEQSRRHPELACGELVDSAGGRSEPARLISSLEAGGGSAHIGQTRRERSRTILPARLPDASEAVRRADCETSGTQNDFSVEAARQMPDWGGPPKKSFEVNK